jgi:hypothetical protein
MGLGFLQDGGQRIQEMNEDGNGRVIGLHVCFLFCFVAVPQLRASAQVSAEALDALAGIL